VRGHMRRRGDSWELRAYAGPDPVSGRQKYVTRTFRGTKRDAEDALARFVVEVSGGGHAPHDATLDDLITQWWELAQGELSSTTLRGYLTVVKTHISPHLGAVPLATLKTVPLAKLKTARLDPFYADLRDHGGREGRPLAPATVRQAHAVIRRALQQAVLLWCAGSSRSYVLGSASGRSTSTGLVGPEAAARPARRSSRENPLASQTAAERPRPGSLGDGFLEFGDGERPLPSCPHLDGC